jgi:hypothetical protein
MQVLQRLQYLVKGNCKTTLIAIASATVDQSQLQISFVQPGPACCLPLTILQ